MAMASPHIPSPTAATSVLTPGHHRHPTLHKPKPALSSNRPSERAASHVLPPPCILCVLYCYQPCTLVADQQPPPPTRRAALDVHELLHADVGAEAGLGGAGKGRGEGWEASNTVVHVMCSRGQQSRLESSWGRFMHQCARCAVWVQGATIPCLPHPAPPGPQATAPLQRAHTTQHVLSASGTPLITCCAPSPAPCVFHPSPAPPAQCSLAPPSCALWPHQALARHHAAAASR